MREKRAFALCARYKKKENLRETNVTIACGHQETYGMCVSNKLDTELNRTEMPSKTQNK